MFAVPRDQLSGRIHAVIGHDGPATVVVIRKNDLANWGDCHGGRSPACCGAQKPGDMPAQMLMGMGCLRAGLGYNLGADNLGLSTVPISGRDDPAAGAPDREFQVPDGIKVTPSYALSILDELRASRHPTAATLFAKVGIFGAEPWTKRPCGSRLNRPFR